MKYGIFFAYWANEWSVDYKQYIDKVSDLGFDILEIHAAAFVDRYSTDAQILDLKEYAQQKGITLTAGFGPNKDQDLSSSDPSIVANAMNFYKDVLKKLYKAGIDYIGGGIFSYWPVDYSQPFDKTIDWKNSVKNMKEVAKIAEEYNIMLGLEVLNRFETYMLNTCAEALEYVDQVDHPNVGLELDTFHMSIEEDSIPSAIRLAGKHLIHLHVGEQNRKVPGKGNQPWREIGIALRDIGYDGRVIMEPFVKTGGKVAEDIKVWHELLPDISDSALDKDAKAALQFLKHVFNA